jgi:hypothetical protein
LRRSKTQWNGVRGAAIGRNGDIERWLATTVIPAKAGIRFSRCRQSKWIPAFAGMTEGWIPVFTRYDGVLNFQPSPEKTD